MHALLARYSEAVRHERGEDGRRDVSLALSVLHKRALSSAWSLAQSVDRRLSALAPSSAAQANQLVLPLGDPHGELVAADEAPSWPPDLRLSDPRREHRMLSALAAVARDASRHESKIGALCRLLHAGWGIKVRLAHFHVDDIDALALQFDRALQDFHRQERRDLGIAH